MLDWIPAWISKRGVGAVIALAVLYWVGERLVVPFFNRTLTLMDAIQDEMHTQSDCMKEMTSAAKVQNLLLEEQNKWYRNQ